MEGEVIQTLTIVFFRDGDVSAVIDRDGARWQSRALEVARVLHFVCDFKADRSVHRR